MHAPTDAKMTRRSLLKGTGAAGLTVLAGTTVSLAQEIELEQPGATPDVAPPPEPLPIGATVAGKAAELGFDVDRMFRFVADEVRYEPYAGALRGANGTLWSMAGNAVDKSLLFAALLDESLVEYRFAFGTLDEAGIEALTAAVTTDPEALADGYVRSQVSGMQLQAPDPLGGGATPPASDDDRRVVEEIAAQSSVLVSRSTELADLHLAEITRALADARVDLPVLETALPAEETERHCWIQVADGPAWIDYAPAIAGAEPGNAPAEATETVTAFPQDLVHQVTIRLVAEEYLGGASVRRDAINVPFASADLVNEPVSILVVPPQSVENIGFTLNELLTGQSAYVPTVLARGIGSFADAPLLFGSGDGVGGALSIESEEGGLADGEALALILVVDITSPGQAPVTVERVLYDRVGFAARQAGEIDFSAIEPVTTVTDSEGQSYIAGLTSAHLLSVDSARIPYGYAVRDVARQATFGELAMANPGLLALRDGLRMEIEVPQGSTSWIASPQVTLVSASKVDPDDLGSAMVVEYDLLHHGPVVGSVDRDVDAGVHPALLAGVLDQVAEQVSVEMAEASVTDEADIGFGASLGAIFAAATEGGVAIVALTTPDDLSQVSLEPEPTFRIRAALEAGLVVIAPETSVDLNGEQRSGWWLIDPVTGLTRDELDSGRGSAKFRVNVPTDARYATFEEETFVIRLGTTASQYYRILGFKIFCYAMWGVTGLAIGFAVGGPGAAGNMTGAAASAGAGAAAAGAAAIGGC